MKAFLKNLFTLSVAILANPSPHLLATALTSDTRFIEFKPVIYSTQVKRILFQVNDYRDNTFSFQECDLNLNSSPEDLSYPTYEFSNCRLLVDLWMSLSDENLERFNLHFTKNLNEVELEARPSSKFDKVLYGTLTILFTGSSLVGFQRSIHSNSLSGSLRAGLLGVASLVATGITLTLFSLAFTPELPSIEEALKEENDAGEMTTPVYAPLVYRIVYQSLIRTLNELSPG